MSRRGFLLLAGLLLILSPAAARAQNFNIDLGWGPDSFGQPSSGYGAASGQTGTWVGLGLGTATNLTDVSGAVTAVDADVTAGPDPGWSGSACGGDIGALLSDDVYSTGGASWTVSLSSLQDGDYTLYLYAPQNNLVPTGAMTVNGTPVSGITGDACALSAGVTHTVVNVTVTGGTLSISGSEPGTYAGLAGLQLVLAAPAVPVPPVPISSGALGLLTLLLASAALFALRR